MRRVRARNVMPSAHMSVGWVDEDKLSCTSCNVPRDLPTEVKILNFFFSL